MVNACFLRKQPAVSGQPPLFHVKPSRGGRVTCMATCKASVYGGLRSFPSCLKTFEIKSNMVDFSSGAHLQEISLMTQSTPSLTTSFGLNDGQYSSMDINKKFFYQNEINYINDLVVDNYHHPVSLVNEAHGEGTGELSFGESASQSMDQKMMDFNDQLDNTIQLSKPSNVPSLDIGDSSALVSDSVTTDTNSLSSSDMIPTDALTEITKTINGTVNNLENSLSMRFSRVISTVTSSLTGAKEAVNDAVGKLVSSVDKSADFADGKLTRFSSDLKEASGRIGVIVVDVLRQTIVVVEDSLAQGAKSIVYAYGSVKELLPSEIQDALKLSEEKATIVFGPLSTSFKQAYIALEELEKSLGIDPNDPIVTFVLFLGASATLWVSYRVLTYGGYSGDLSAKSTLELLKGKEKAVLVDIRPEDLRERDGIPDLRRTTRSRYASVTLPEVDRSIRKLLRGGKNIDDTLVAAVIRNLKIVDDWSKVIVMDTDGSRSKGIARSLRKLGIKKPYIVQGGYRSWVEEGLRIKDPRPETTLTVLNEEAEAILEEIKPTPFKVFVYGAGFVATIYSIVEWEKTLQLVGVLGLGLTIYQRFASYKDEEDLKQDLRLLLAPVRLGGQAVSFAAGRLEMNRNGLPTSPSSSDVQNRVLQAAAKHESQPSEDTDGEEQDPSLQSSMASVKEDQGLSEV